MSDAVILEKLDSLSGDVKGLKAEILQELREELAVERQAREAPLPPQSGSSEIEELQKVCEELLTGLNEIQKNSSLLRSGLELGEDLQPIIKQAYPSLVSFCTQLEGEFSLDEMTITLRKFLTNLDTIGEGLDVMKAGIDLRDDMVPIIQIAYPKLVRALTALHQGEFRAERLGDLFHTLLMNTQTLSDLLNIIKPFTELVKEVGVILQQTSILPSINTWLHGLQTTSPVMNLLQTATGAIRQFDLTEEKVAQMCEIIRGTDFGKTEPISAFGMVKKLNDPQVQESLGFMFTMLHVMGGCLQVIEKKDDTTEQDAA